jgi:hypothetical protein
MKVLIGDTVISEDTATDVYAELKSGSITPRSLEYRKYEESLEDLKYIEKYSNEKQVSVLRFSINTGKVELKAKKTDDIDTASSSAIN